jgi:hypothetical protein
MPDDRFRQEWSAGRFCSEISKLNERLTGWAPNLSSVSYHAKSLGLPTRTKQWMPDARFREEWVAGRTLEEIRRLNERLTGYLPTRTSVSDHATALWLPSRVMSNNDMLPWRIRPEHVDTPWRFRLGALSRYRQRGDSGIPACPLCRGKKYQHAEHGISNTDRKAVRRLHIDLLHDGKRHLVVTYSEIAGFDLVNAKPGDDIIRRPLGIDDRR